MSAPERHIEIAERPEVPWLSIVFGYGPMLPFAAGAAAAWILDGYWREEAILLTSLWAATILAFLSGVRRGLSFRTQGGEAVAQIATMLVLFILALAALVALTHGSPGSTVACLLVGFALIFVLDPIAARRGQAPLFFIRLRRPQMAIAVLRLATLLAATLGR